MKRHRKGKRKKWLQRGLKQGRKAEVERERENNERGRERVCLISAGYIIIPPLKMKQDCRGGSVV